MAQCDRTTVCVLDRGHRGQCERPGGVRVVTTSDVEHSQSETSLPGLRAFSQRTVHAIEALDTALTQENVTEAANACHWLMDELDNVRGALIGLMAKAGR